MKKLNQLGYFLLYGLITGNFLTPLYLILYLPSLIIWRLEGIEMATAFFDRVFFIQLGASLLLWLVSYLVIKSAKSARQLFFTTLVIINLSYIYALLPVLTTYQILPIVWITELIFIFFSWILAMAWDRVWHQNQLCCKWLIWLPFLASLILVFKESPGSMNGMIFRTYLHLGENLKKVTQGAMNLFFMDFTGFAVLFINLINILIICPVIFTPKSKK